jgi:hypothetical protein
MFAPMLRALLASLSLAAGLAAQVVGFDLAAREPAAEGRVFGEVGSYELLSGTARLALDPRNPFNARIVDLDLAPRNAAGRVEAAFDLLVLQPSDPEQRRGTALVEVVNRGGRASLSHFNRGGSDPRRAEAFGDGLLMRLGLTLVFVGWQQDLPERSGLLGLRGPTLTQADGRAIEGPVRADWVVDQPTRQLGLGHRDHRPFGIVDPDSDRHRLTRRSGREAGREPVPRHDWSFDADGRAILGTFEPGFIYELVYLGRDPVVTGLGFAAVRDLASWLENDPDCPCRVERTVALGISQTGRFLRHMLWQGFTTDTEGRGTLDGVLALTAGAGRGSFNHRFAQPSRDAHAYSAFFFPTDLFPFSSGLQLDPVSGRFDGLFARQHDPDHLPKAFWVNTGYEYWGRAAALIHTTVDGARDLEPTARERLYHVRGAQHYPGDLRTNPIDLRAVHRALLVAMLEWVEDGVEPPASSVPRRDTGSLVTADALQTPTIGTLRWPTQPQVAYRADYGPEFWTRGVASLEPPRLGPAFPALVPAVDALGNERGGLAPLEVRVPVGTYLPWRLRAAPPDGPAAIEDFVGRLVPLPRDEARRELDRDPRPSLDALYGSAEVYEAEARRAAAQMVAERVLLAEDLEPLVAHAVGLYEFAAGR